MTWKLNSFRKERQTLAQILADRMDEFWDDCEDAITGPDGKLMPPRASKLAFPWLGPADWIKFTVFYRMQALLDEEGVFTPSALSGEKLVKMASLTSPYIMDADEFQDLLEAVPPERATELRSVRQNWFDALEAPASRIPVGESASVTLARIQHGPTVSESYEQGRNCLKQDLVQQSSEFHFLAPYAIARVRSLNRLGAAEPSAAPAFGKISQSESLAIELIYRALGAGLDITDLMAELLPPEGKDEDKGERGPLAEYVYAVQLGACNHLIGAPIPDPLPMDAPRRQHDLNQDMCDAATLLVRFCLLYGKV